MRNVRLHTEVYEELDSASKYLNDERPGFGAEFQREVHLALEQIDRNPALWKVRSRGYRRYVLQRFGYLIWFRETDEEIFVIAVHHGTRKPGYWKQRILDDEQR